MAWLAREDPDAAAEARWLLAELGRARACGSSGEAATTLQGHETALGAGDLEAAGVRPAQCRRPARRSARRSGRSARTRRRRSSGCRPRIPVVAGVNDGTASMLGAGLRRARRRGGHRRDVRRASAIYADRAIALPGLFVAPAPLPGRWVVGGAMAALGAPGRLDARGGAPATLVAPTSCSRPRRAVPPGADGLLFLPYLAGERAPLFDEAARGAFVGLTLAHGRAQLARAVLEGAAFALRHVAEPLAAAGAPIRELRLAGRASPATRGPGSRPTCSACRSRSRSIGETAVLGAAILAAAGTGRAGPRGGRRGDDGRRPAHRAGSGVRARYDELFDVYRVLYPALAPSMHALGRGGG